MASKPIVAIMYDFDKTLSTTDMQNYTFIPSLGLSPEEFWSATGEFSKKEGVERILSYMYMMIYEAKKAGIKLTREFLQKCGKDIKFYPGVSTWFKRINDYGLSKGVVVEHYLVSSGTKEIVEGCAIFSEFKEAYACEYYYNELGEPVWPKLAINYTQKTQYFFRIAKGVTEIANDDGVNQKTSEYRIPYQNIIYVGDGMTDIACMTLVKKNKGHSIAVYPNKESSKVKNIFEENRCDFICPADYQADSWIEKVVKSIIDKVAIDTLLENKQKFLSNK